MKKIFTLIATAMVALGMNAQSEWRPTEEAPASGTTVLDDDLLKVETVFETTNNKAEVGEEGAKEPVSFTIDGKSYSFNYFTQVRVDEAPKAGAETGTDKGGSSPLVITAKKDVDITMFYRRQQVSSNCGDNDGKDLKLVDWDKPAAAIAASTFGWVAIAEGNIEYAYAMKLYKMEAGKKYVLWARGTTIQFYGFNYQSGSGAEVVPPAADGEHIISFDGMSAANVLEYGGTLNGFKLQITGNESKTISGAKSISIDGKSYTSMKVSNGAENTIFLPEGKVASSITFYSYVNFDDAENARPSYWKDVAGTAFDPEVSGVKFEAFQTPETPDVRTFNFKGGKLNKITFTNTGEQCCYVIKVTIESGDEVAPETVELEGAGSTDGIATLKVQSQNSATFNLAGQQVNAGFKGIAIQNGKKVIMK